MSPPFRSQWLRRGLITLAVLGAVVAVVMWFGRSKPVPVIVAEVGRGKVESTIANTRAGSVEAIYSKNVGARYNTLFISIIDAAFRRLGVNKIITLALLISYPMLFAISRGNAELAVFAIVLLSISYFIKNEFRTALILIMVAIIIKPTSLIFLAIFPLKTLLTHWRILAGAFLAGLLIMASLNLNILNFMHVYLIMLENYKLAYIYGTGGDLFNNSFFGLLKAGTYLFAQGDSAGRDALIKSISGSYGLIVYLILFACILFVQFAKNIPLSTKVWLLAASIAFLPHVSPDYRLLYLLIPISLVLIKEQCSHIENTIFYGTLILLMPKHFVAFNFPEIPSLMTLQSIVNPIMFFGLLLAFSLFRSRATVLP